MARLRRAIFGSGPQISAKEAVARHVRFREAAHAGDLARNAGDWATAAARYADALAIDGDQPAIRTQYGHALKESGRLTEAEIAYRIVAEADPTDAESWVQLGHILKLQRRTDAAIDAFLEALRRDPSLMAVRAEVIAAGARDRLNDDAFGRSATAARLANLSTTLAEVLDQVHEHAAVSPFAVPAYDAFRRQYPVRPAPGPMGPILVLVDAVDAAPSALRSTLISLMDQSSEDWRALIVTGANLRDHPVASWEQMDNRFHFCSPDALPQLDDMVGAEASAPTLLLPGGALLDPEALGWLSTAIARTGADAVYADHDHFETHWRRGVVRSQPALQSMADRHDLATSPHPPALIVVSPALRASLFRQEKSILGSEGRRALLSEALARGPVAHLPRILVSLPTPEEPPTAPVSERRKIVNDSRIRVVIPTRDESDMLAACISTLKGRAARPHLLDLLVIDNRSTREETSAFFSDLARDGDATVVAMDEPFNWARLNNQAAATIGEDLLVFANNDVEMITDGWDDRLRAWLEQPDVGVVGARLLYPDGALQHGGILLGGWEGRPSHDGLWAAQTDGGPLGRWHRSRAAAAVTGAFMACRREIFEQVGGFDERLAIAYNDIDFCLRAREIGWTVLYAADIELIHHESRTRGQNDTAEKVAWDDGELADLHERWGPALFFDPSFNPQWVSAVNRPFDGFRDISNRRVLEHLVASVRPDRLPQPHDDAGGLTRLSPRGT